VAKQYLALLAALGAALVVAAPAAAFTPSNTYYAEQWYLAQDRAFDAWPTPPAGLAPVKVAVVDSGVDCSLPDFKGRILRMRSFVGGSACDDVQGHGTIVAGEIAGDLGSNGVVGIAYSSQLLVAKVVRTDGTIPLAAEAAAIRWAANQGARVINLSFGAVRDPLDPALDSYSKREAQAVAYAYGKGAVIVAAVGNADQAPVTPWPYASWPAALPHVIGVAALTRSGNVPTFSDNDPIYVDLSAPGVDIFSTFPQALTAGQSGCSAQGYTACAIGDYRHPTGTSFAAPQVAAAAAMLFATDPALTNSQVAAILEKTAHDVNAANGCPLCRVGRDRYSGWGRLDVAKAIALVNSGAPLPPPDRYEPNNNLSQAYPLWGKNRTLSATVDRYENPLDVFRTQLARGERLVANTVTHAPHQSVDLILRPPNPSSRRPNRPSPPVTQSVGPSRVHRLQYRAKTSGWYYLEIRANPPTDGAFSLTPYSLTLTKTGARPQPP
jgi:subtilisin family serine protease